MSALLRTLILSITALTTALAQAETVTVAVASNFAEPMRAIAAQFERASGHKLHLAFGSSGKLHAQIVNGAPYHLFFSADQQTVDALQTHGSVEQGSRFTYAVGALALWSPEPGYVDEQGRVLKDRQFGRLAIANPRVAPYGQAALQVLEQLGLAEASRPQRVQGENVAQVYQFVASGNADLGFLALSQIYRDGRLVRGSAWRVPGDLHSPIKQDAVLLKHGANSTAARQLLSFMRSDQAVALIESFGYHAPSAP